MIDQLGIFGFGVAAVWLVNSPTPTIARWGCICGFVAEPFWFYTGFVNDQWGIVGLAFIYAYSWGRGIWHQWIKPKE